ncbi:MAG: aldehyde dehydrogenase [Chloroflexi bacterium]|nr:aldehyde dehydrogenase [Chloroflexota bacterium]
MTILTRENWLARATQVTPRTQAFIDGQFVDALSGKTFEDVSPRDGCVIAHVAECDQDDIDRAVTAARRAFEDGRWSSQDPAARKRVLLKLAELIRDHLEELALLETLDVGKPISDSLAVDVPFAANCFQWYAETIDKTYDEIAPRRTSALALITREPMGVVGAVVPWNYPLIISAWKLAPALATGNSVVLKPAEQSPLTALRLAELAMEAGLPPGVLNVVPGYGPTAGAALGRHMEVDKLTFTGSTEVGKLFLRYASESNMKAVSLECGGKSPQIVLADAPDLDAAASGIAWGIFYNQGETCHAGSRVLVERPIREALIEKVRQVAGTITLADPLDPGAKIGAIVDKTQMERILYYITQGTQEGAQIRLGGTRVMVETGGYYISPTIFAGVRHQMSIAREEIFGPVLSVIDFDTPEEAVRIANDTHYGLAASVWTQNITTAHRMARALRAGTVWINCFDVSDLTVPFGGFKQSGTGRDKSLHALEQYTQLKTTWIQL